MAFDPNSLLAPDTLRAAAADMGERWAPVATLCVENISPHIELLAFHRRLTALFDKKAHGVAVDLREAFLIGNPINPEEDRLKPQECKIILTPAVEPEISIPLIQDALEQTYSRRGLMFDPHGVEIREMSPGF